MNLMTIYFNFFKTKFFFSVTKKVPLKIRNLAVWRFTQHFKKEGEFFSVWRKYYRNIKSYKDFQLIHFLCFIIYIQFNLCSGKKNKKWSEKPLKRYRVTELLRVTFSIPPFVFEPQVENPCFRSYSSHFSVLNLLSCNCSTF